MVSQAVQGAPLTQDDAGVQLATCNETWQFNAKTPISKYHFVVPDESKTYPVELKDAHAVKDQYPVSVKQDATQTSIKGQMPTSIYTPSILTKEQRLLRLSWKNSNGNDLEYRFFNLSANSACRVKYSADLGALMDAVYVLPTKDDLAVGR